MYSLSGVRVSRAGRDILLLPELTVPTDAFTVILGHNGSGKSTLASLLSGLARPDAGSVRLDGDEVSAVPERARARRVAFLPQKLPASEGLTCRELVRLGRHPWRGLLGRWRPQDEAIIDASLRMTGTERFAADWADELSGGERQRVWIAMLLAQAAPVMILDEPTSALDVKHQYGVLALLERLREEKGVGVITIIHDVNLLHENVVFAVDRAGFVPGDGETHQGIYDPAFLSQTGMPIYSPSNYEELRHWLPILLSHEMQGPRAIRYPRGGESKALAKYGCSGKEYDKLVSAPGAKTALVSYADEVEDVLTAAELLAKEGIPCDVYKLVRIFPFEEELIRDLSAYPVVLMAEECVACGGIGEHLARALQDAGWQGRYIHRAVKKLCLPHATVPQIKQTTGLDAAHLAEAVREADPKGEKTL